jgi:hypothetical protein
MLFSVTRQGRSADGGIHAARTTLISEVYCEKLKKKLFRAIQKKRLEC